MVIRHEQKYIHILCKMLRDFQETVEQQQEYGQIHSIIITDQQVRKIYQEQLRSPELDFLEYIQTSPEEI